MCAVSLHDHAAVDSHINPVCSRDLQLRLFGVHAAVLSPLVSRAVEVADAARSEASEAKARARDLEQQLHQAQADSRHAKTEAAR